MIERTADVTVRTVVYKIPPGESPNLQAQYSDYTFRPDWVEVEIRDGALDRVTVNGPVQTKAGTDNTSMRPRDWSWSARPYGKVWPPEDAPEIAQRVVADVLDGQAVTTS